MTIKAGSLKYVPNREYEIMVVTDYFGQSYQQKVRVTIKDVDILPLPIITYVTLTLL